MIEADVNGDIKTYSWVVKETPKSTGGTFDKDTFVITDLGMKFGRYGYEYLNACFRMRILSLVWPIRVLMNTLCRFAAISRPKLPLSAPFPQVIFSDAQYTILPDVSSYRYPDKTVYVSTVSI